MVGLATDGWRDTDDVMAGGPSGKTEEEEEEDDLSPEDAAWVDSCLAKDDGGEGKGDCLSDDAWAALTEAFVAALAYSASGTSTAATTTVQDEDKVAEYAGSREASRSRGNPSGDDYDYELDADDGSIFQADDALTEELASSPTASTYAAAASFYEQPYPTLGDSPLPAGQQLQGLGDGRGSSNGRLDVVIGSDYPEEQGYGDGEDEFSFAAGSEEVGEVELARDVFRVWELEVPKEEEEGEEEEEEEEFGRQLRKALEGSSVGAVTPPPLADLEWKMDSSPNPDLDEQLVLDDVEEDLRALIAGINDMSLGRPSSPPDN